MAPLLSILLRLGLGAVFLVSGYLKVEDPGRFLVDVQAFQLVSYPVAYATAMSLPWLEMFAGVGLILGVFYRGSLLWLSGLTGFFIYALVDAERRGLDLECGCFGDWLVFPSLEWHLAFNTTLLLGLFYLIARTGRSKRR